MSQLQFGLQEVELEPVHGLIRQPARAQRFDTGAGDDGARAQHGPVIAQNLRVADPRIHHRHRGALVAQDAHDRVQAGPLLRQLSADGVPEPVRRHGASASGIDQSGLTAGSLQGRLEQVMQRQTPPVHHEQVAHAKAGDLVGAGPIRTAISQRLHHPDRLGRLVVQGHNALTQRFAGRQPQPRCPVGVAVKAVNGEATHLRPPRAGPARHE